MHLIFSALAALATALCSAAAAYYWWLSSLQKTVTTEPPIASISDNPEEHLLVGHVNIGALEAALRESSRLNKIAAKWSALAAGCATVAALLSAF
jgi:hypothetical protein